MGLKHKILIFFCLISVCFRLVTIISYRLKLKFQANRSRMDVACVIDTVHTDHLAHRKCAYDELKQACSLTNANLHHIQVVLSN